MKHFNLLVLALFASVTAFAQSGAYQLGDKVAGFSATASDSRTVALSEFSGAKAVVLVFMNNQCAYSKQYESRLVALANAYAGKGVQFIFLNPSVGTGEGSETLQDMASKNYTFPYLADEGQQLTAKFGATKTPEAFVLHNTGSDFVLKYRGAIDDNPQVETGVKSNYLKNVIDEVLENKTVTSLGKRPIGCMIRKN